MERNAKGGAGIFQPRIFFAFALVLTAAFLAVFSFAGPSPQRAAVAAATAATPTFGHPVISGIGGTGFEESVRTDPTNPNRIYTSAPGTASADTSWIWHSLDGVNESNELSTALWMTTNPRKLLCDLCVRCVRS
jgi:hypothetical protein